MRPRSLIVLAALCLVFANSPTRRAAAEVLPPGGLAGGAVDPNGNPAAFAAEERHSSGTEGGGGGAAEDETPCTWVSVDRDSALLIYEADGRVLDDNAERWSVRRCSEPGGGFSVEAFPEGAGVDPAVLAAQAVQSVSIPAPAIGTSPAAGVLVVRVPTWLWVDAGWWQSYSATATAGGVSATVTAQPTRATWSTGDGVTLNCSGPGTVWALGMAEEATDCSHTYTSSSEPQPAGTFTLSVAVEFDVAWMSNVGASGSLPVLSRGASTQVQVGEIQAIETR